MGVFSLLQVEPELKGFFQSSLCLCSSAYVQVSGCLESWLRETRRHTGDSPLAQRYFKCWLSSPVCLLLFTFQNPYIAVSWVLYRFYGCIWWERQGQGYLLPVTQKCPFYFYDWFSSILHFRFCIWYTFSILGFTLSVQGKDKNILEIFNCKHVLIVQVWWID